MDGSGPLGPDECGHRTTASTTIRASTPAPAATHGHIGAGVGAGVGAGRATDGWGENPTEGGAAGAEA